MMSLEREYHVIVSTHCSTWLYGIYVTRFWINDPNRTLEVPRDKRF